MAFFRKNPHRSFESTSQIPHRRILSTLTPWLAFVLFYGILANVPYWAASRWLGLLHHGWLGLDYMALGLLALFLPRFVCSTLLLVAVTVDVLAGVCETYYLTIEQCFTNLNALGEFPGNRIFAMVAIVVLSLLAAIAAPFLLPPVPKRLRLPVAACLVGIAAVSVAIDCVTILRATGRLPYLVPPHRSTPDPAQPGYLTQLRIARLSAFRLVREAIYPTPTGYPMRSAAALALRYTGVANKSPQAPNLVLVLVESWGLDSESAISNALVQPYAQQRLAARYNVFQGTVPFHGPTAAGEARELCGSTMGFHVMEAPVKELQPCLPDRLAAAGYHVVALHGMNGDFYHRFKWYPRIGFHEIWFEDRFAQLGLPTCRGSFSGICDASIAQWIGQRLNKDRASPDFLYWVTLNSHLPVIVPSPLKAGASCAFTPSLAQQPALCSWYQLEANVHRSVADLAMANLGRPTVFVIVGDHAPPFTDLKLRNRFSNSTVPYVLLIPRSDNAENAAPSQPGK